PGGLPRRLSPPIDRTEPSDPLRSQRQSDFPRWPHRAQKRRQMGDGLRRPDNQYAYGKFERGFIEQTGGKMVVGKGGMGPLTEEGCQKFKALHVIFPAGCAVLAATQVEEIEEVHWTELGMPESLWVCRVKEFGPLIVSIDTHGNNLIAENKKLFA